MERLTRGRVELVAVLKGGQKKSLEEEAGSTKGLECVSYLSRPAASSLKVAWSVWDKSPPLSEFMKDSITPRNLQY